MLPTFFHLPTTVLELSSRSLLATSDGNELPPELYAAEPTSRSNSLLRPLTVRDLIIAACVRPFGKLKTNLKSPLGRTVYLMFLASRTCWTL
jgi:hypothetical protein